MGFHSDNRQLPSPGSSLAASVLHRELEAIHAKTGIAARCGRVAEETMAYDKYRRTVSNDQNRTDNMSRGGNGRGAVPNRNRGGMHSSSGHVTSYDHAQTQGPSIMFIFWAGVIWLGIYKAGLQPFAWKVCLGIIALIGEVWPIIIKVIFLCADILTALIQQISHIH